VRLEKVLSDRVVGGAGHDVPGYGCAVVLAGFAELFGEKLKERFVT
jgi:hypothetical protein